MDAKDYFEDVLNKWENQLRVYIDDFERYSRAMSELDNSLFEYVTKLNQCQQDQDEVEMKQQDIMNNVSRIEAKQKAMMDVITKLQQKVGDKESDYDSNLERRSLTSFTPFPVEKAKEVNKTIQDLESSIIELGTEVDKLEQDAYDDDLAELVNAISTHSRILTQLEDMARIAN